MNKNLNEKGFMVSNIQGNNTRSVLGAQLVFFKGLLDLTEKKKYLFVTVKVSTQAQYPTC